VTIDLRNGWTVTTFGPPASGGVLQGNPLVLLLSGIALSVLVAALMLVLRTGRARALRLVAERTDELRHQALHDALTDLPNRALIMDRIEQLLVRSRRNGTTGAALFIDLDDFKNVNDSLGHEAGDRLLVAVAARMPTRSGGWVVTSSWC
jgi:PleD family two-component response regulator